MNPEVERIQAEKLVLEDKIRKLNEEMVSVTCNEFLTILKEGQWTYVDGRLMPKHSDTDKYLVQLFTHAYNLGYHDDFVIYKSKHVQIHAYVDDGELTIRLFVDRDSNIAEAQGELQRIALDVDIKDIFIKRYEYQLRDEQDALKQAQQSISDLKNILKALRGEK